MQKYKTKKVSERNKVFLNMFANVLSFVVSLVISFFLTPYITSSVGTEAYGLVGLANSFVNYIQVITAALNSMASRFIIIELHKKKSEEANKYFSSVLMANTFFAIVLLIPAIWLIVNISILNVSSELLFDARMTFSIIFINFAISLIGAFWGIVLYAKNILWKGAFRTLESNIIRIFIIIIFFSVVGKRIYFVVLATVIAGIYVLAFNFYYTKRYLKLKNSIFPLMLSKS